MVIRPMRLSDAWRLRQWRDEESRKYSGNPKPIPCWRHWFWVFDQWFNGCCWICVSLGVPVGCVRVEHGRVSILVAPKFRGQGIGFALLRWLCSSRRDPLWAEIHQENIASQRLFAGIGFVRAQPNRHDGEWTYWELPAR